jgi:hypothetical protein
MEPEQCVAEILHYLAEGECEREMLVCHLQALGTWLDRRGYFPNMNDDRIQNQLRLLIHAERN